MLEHLLAVEPAEIRLKWVFDHVTNYGVAAVVMITGFYLFKHGSTVDPLPCAGIVFGSLLIILGLVLSVLNIVQPIYAMAKQKIPMVPYMIVSIIIFLAASEFVWVTVGKA
jgi:hypothetical protein